MKMVRGVRSVLSIKLKGINLIVTYVIRYNITWDGLRYFINHFSFYPYKFGERAQNVHEHVHLTATLFATYQFHF